MSKLFTMQINNFLKELKLTCTCGNELKDEFEMSDGICRWCLEIGIPKDIYLKDIHIDNKGGDNE